MEVLACGVNLHLTLKHRQRKEKKLLRGITDCWKTGTHTTQVQDIDTGGRATLPVPGAVLEPPVLRQVAPRNARWRLRSRNVHSGRGRTDNRPAYSWLGARRAGKRFPRSIAEPRRRERAQHNKPLSRLRPETLRARGN